MGWSMNLTADKPISEADVHAALTKIEEYEPHKNEWGWTTSCDVSLPKGNSLHVSGAWFSFDYATEFGRDLAAELRRRGYQIKTTKPE